MVTLATWSPIVLAGLFACGGCARDVAAVLRVEVDGPAQAMTEALLLRIVIGEEMRDTLTFAPRNLVPERHLF
jgi:hypothetical protein